MHCGGNVLSLSSRHAPLVLLAIRKSPCTFHAEQHVYADSPASTLKRGYQQGQYVDTFSFPVALTLSYISMMIQPKCIVQLMALAPHERRKCHIFRSYLRTPTSEGPTILLHQSPPELRLIDMGWIGIRGIHQGRGLAVVLSRVAREP